LAEAGIEASVGSVGDSYDNALAETIIGLYKTEVIRHRGPWRNLEAVEFATLEWVHWFNHHRLLEAIGYVPPAERELAYHRRQTESAIAARLNQNGLRKIRGGSTQFHDRFLRSIPCDQDFLAHKYETCTRTPISSR